MLNIAVCDDENAMINDIENMLLDVCKKQNIRADIDVFCSGETLGKEVMMGTKYDMIFLDIEMEKVNGIESAKAIRKMDQNVIFIYVSAHDRYALELFCLDVFAFIKKPIDKEEFRNCCIDVSPSNAAVFLAKCVFLRQSFIKVIPECPSPAAD